MTTAAGITQNSSEKLEASDPQSALTRIFTGRVTGKKGLSEGVVAAKVTGATATTVTATVTGLQTLSTPNGTGYQPTVTAYYQAVPGASPSTPPAGTTCFIAFPANEPQKIGVVVAFVEWP